MINKFKIIFIGFLISLLNITGVGIAKPLPPGSGAGDIPANILILLDTSESMNSNPFGGDMLSKVGDVILLDDGDILVGQMDSAGVVKMNYASEELDRTFNNNKGLNYYYSRIGRINLFFEDKNIHKNLKDLFKENLVLQDEKILFYIIGHIFNNRICRM